MGEGDNGRNARMRQLPSVDRVLNALGDLPPTSTVTAAARQAIDDSRARIVAGEPAPSFHDIVAGARSILDAQRRSRLQPVLNATGVIVHTNLGRVPLGTAQLEAVARIAGGYSNLEYDLQRGERGSRYAHARAPIRTVTGAESSLVVNNNAAALLLVLSTLCSGREVIISRGELVEIGGEFRIPEIMSASGAVLKEVGTTNRTHLSDYERAIGPESVAILKVHPSNYRMVGFTSEVPARDIARLARGRGVLFVYDLGSGLAIDSTSPALRSEPLVSNAIADGADLITFSGDKLLGGPQAGIVAGREELVSSLAKAPLMRALRVDKMTLAALEATFEAYLRDTPSQLPMWKMFEQSEEDLRGRATRIADQIDRSTDAKAESVPLRSVTGGGSAPGVDVASWGVLLSHPERRADEVDALLRAGDPPVVGRIENDNIVLDVRTVPPVEDDRLLSAVTTAMRKG